MEQITIKRLQELQESISYLDNFGTEYKSTNVIVNQKDKNYRNVKVIYEDGDDSYVFTDKLHKLAELNTERDKIINEIMNFREGRA